MPTQTATSLTATLFKCLKKGPGFAPLAQIVSTVKTDIVQEVVPDSVLGRMFEAPETVHTPLFLPHVVHNPKDGALMQFCRCIILVRSGKLSSEENKTNNSNLKSSVIFARKRQSGLSYAA